MKKFMTSDFRQANAADIASIAAEYKAQGLAFVQLCATTKESSCEILYTFQDPTYIDGGIQGVIIDVPDGEHVDSITDSYPAAFVFENEAHDLFGIQIDGINIDFGGEFYTVAVAYPMNPRAAQPAAQQPVEGEEASNE